MGETTPPHPPSILKLTPIVRVMLTFDREMQLDTADMFNEARYQNYVRMQALSERKRDLVMRTVIVSDLILFFLLYSETISIPVAGIDLKSLPGALQIVTFVSSFSFFFLSLSWVTWHCYTMIVQQFCVRKALPLGIDPDFLSASDKYTEFAVKVFQKKFYVYGTDFFRPSRPYRVISTVILALITASMLALVVLHLLIVSVSMRTIYDSAQNPLALAYLLFTGAANVCSVLVLIASGWAFTFYVDVPPRPRSEPPHHTP